MLATLHRNRHPFHQPHVVFGIFQWAEDYLGTTNEVAQCGTPKLYFAGTDRHRAVLACSDRIGHVMCCMLQLTEMLEWEPKDVYAWLNIEFPPASNGKMEMRITQLVNEHMQGHADDESQSKDCSQAFHHTTKECTNAFVPHRNEYAYQPWIDTVDIYTMARLRELWISIRKRQLAATAHKQ